MKRYGIYSPAIRDFLTFEGRVITHDNRYEMEFLFPGAQIRETGALRADQCLPLPLHPDLCTTKFPLDRSQFRAKR